MPLYFFSLKTRNAIPHVERQGEFPDLRAALADAHSAARTMLHSRRRHAPLDLHGSLDVEDEQRRPVARILLADVARQIS
jgi:hypothetical protein